MTDYTNIATIATGVGAVGVGAYLTQINQVSGATLIAVGLALLGYKSLKKGNTPPPATAPAPATPPTGGAGA
jgi:hypothetical protein